MATALYHTMIMPSLFMDSDNSYRGLDGDVHQAKAFRYYSNFSLWDTYRTLHPLLTLLKPNRQRDMIASLIAMGQQGGALPKWPMGVAYTNTMVGSPADIMIADAYLKGITQVDIDTALRLMLETASARPGAETVYQGRVGIEHYVELGYVPEGAATEATSRTLEFAVADAAIAALAKKLGHKAIAGRFAESAQNYRKLWDSESSFFRNNDAGGSFTDPFDPLASEIFRGRSYSEGNAWQYRWMVPHDPQGLVDLFPSPQAMVETLQQFFNRAIDEVAQQERIVAERSSAHDEASELALIVDPPNYYWHGNEPALHAAYLFDCASRPDLTQRWTRWIAETLYSGRRPDLLRDSTAGKAAHL